MNVLYISVLNATKSVKHEYSIICTGSLLSESFERLTTELVICIKCTTPEN